MERLCERNEMLSLEKSEAQAQNQILQEENHHLFLKVRELAAEHRAQTEELQLTRNRVAELEQVVGAQTEQVSFLALQLQRVIERDQIKPRGVPAKASDAKDGEQVAAATQEKRSNAAASLLHTSPPRGPLGSERLAECLEGGLVCDSSVQCLAAALHGRLNASSGASNMRRDGGTHAAELDVFFEPEPLNSFLEETREEAQSPTLQHSVSGSERSAISPCSPFANSQLSKWQLCEHIAEVMQIFQMQPEVSVIALVYLDRFSECSGTAITNDNWQRLMFMALILAMKVWDEAPFDNEEIAQISPQYSLSELCTLEKAFMQALEFDLSVQDAEYADVQQMLRTFGAQSEPSPATLDADRAAALMDQCRQAEATLRQRYAEGSQKGTGRLRFAVD